MDELKAELYALKSKVQGNGKVEGSLEFRIIMLEARHKNIEKEVSEIKGAIDQRMDKFESLVSRVGWTVVLAVLGAVISSVLL